MKIPIINFQPLLEATEREWREYLREFFDRRQFILGPQVAAFEKELAATFQAREVVGVGSGTAAIELCLREAGIDSPKQEVLTSALTAPFTGIGIVTAGCRLRLADVDPETLLVDPDDAGNRMTKRTAALVPVHLYGQPCNLKKLNKLARSFRAILIQDACQAHGAALGGLPFTKFSSHVAYSFYPTKNLGALGDGGAIATSSQKVARRLRSLRDGGRQSDQVAHRKGTNSRLDELQACFLRAFLPKLWEWNQSRREIAALYRKYLADCGGIRLLKESEDSVHHLFVIRADRRDRLREHLAKHEIGTGVHYPVPLHLMPAFRETGLRRGDLPNSEKACREIVSLPLWPFMVENQVLEVVDRIRQFYLR